MIGITGRVIARTPENVNPALPTGEVEVVVDQIEVLSPAEVLPFQVAGTHEIPEDQRLRYRFLDLRREKIHANIVLRSRVIASIRRRMEQQGFLEFQTPILTSSSPEGARDYLVPSRIHPGKFYALPQAPQQFKQLLMVAGFDRYFQIAPCFRDEDARADRSPGEFYQLDVELSFVTQDDVFAAIEPVLAGVFKEFSASARSTAAVSEPPFPRITYDDAMTMYGTDKPDLRNPLYAVGRHGDFPPVGVRGFCACRRGRVGHSCHPGARRRGSIAKLLRQDRRRGRIARARRSGVHRRRRNAEGAPGEVPPGRTQAEAVRGVRCRAGRCCLLRVGAARRPFVAPIDGLRSHLGRELGLIEAGAYRFCWITDFPFFELDPETNQIAFSHNPFSMPQGGLEALNTRDPLTIKAFQYDIVCNGVELSSGAIRNHRPDIMLRAFEIAGYPPDEVEKRFGGMLNAFRYGAPPHGGLAPGIDRIVMLLARGAQSSRSDRLSDDPERRGPAHERALRSCPTSSFVSCTSWSWSLERSEGPTPNSCGTCTYGPGNEVAIIQLSS